MKTTSFSITNYCVPCHTYCRHCLLSSCGKASGLDFDRSLKLGERVITELAQQKNEIYGNYYFGYCMDTPKLFDYIDFCKKYSLASARFLQMNGFAFRSESELDSLIKRLKDAGIEMIDLTFYGTEEYHDKFAGRKGDFDFILKMLDSAIKNELTVNISIPLMKENIEMMPELRQLLDKNGASKYSYFLPHSKGRGKLLEDQRLTKSEFETLPQDIKDSFWKIKHMTEAEWITSEELEEPQKRALTLVLTPDNIDHFESMSALDILNELEAMDDNFLNKMPSVPELAKRFGRPDNQQLYRFRDLLLRWRQEYIKECGSDLYDMHDEAHHFSIHM
ncbi:radical SAM protein [Butyrivibrio fibrisolvens]|uniref:radical SAM protein n=1 Tax=Butyrivibrio fibrisolvens TaxID=831 RepID=UPI00041839AA|nr:radical SAM protein [Butyrivibrio fibrisolvens]